VSLPPLKERTTKKSKTICEKSNAKKAWEIFSRPEIVKSHEKPFVLQKGKQRQKKKKRGKILPVSWNEERKKTQQKKLEGGENALRKVPTEGYGFWREYKPKS